MAETGFVTDAGTHVLMDGWYDFNNMFPEVPSGTK